jgi:hypothetical protein
MEGVHRVLRRPISLNVFIIPFHIISSFGNVPAKMALTLNSKRMLCRS